jgi:large subunit ribosomal protein L18
MMNKKIQSHNRRKISSRSKVKKFNNNQPRIVIDRSLNHFSAQLVTPSGDKVLTFVTSKGKDFSEQQKSSKLTKTDTATVLGKQLGEKIKLLQIERVVFDRSGYLYHGRVKAFAEGARTSGIKF